MLIKKALTAFHDYRIRKQCHRKKASILKFADRVFQGPSKKTLSDYRRLWKPLIGEADPFYCSIYTEINGNESSLYIPESAYYTVIEPVLNNRAFSLAYADKGFYDILTRRSDLLPKTMLKGIAGVVYDSNLIPVAEKVNLLEYLPIGMEFVLKPASDSAGGRGVGILKVTGENLLTAGDRVFDTALFREFLLKVYRNNFVIQEKIEQHPWFADFNQTSVNTVRMMTYREPFSESIHCLRSVLRFGRPGSIVDNQASGGMSCGIGEDGRIQGFAIDKYGRRSDVLRGRDEVPGFQIMRDAATGIAQRYPYHRVLGFDFCVNAAGEVKLLEINTRNLEINFMQMNLGPLFREFTGEVIDFCMSHSRTIVLDWELLP